MVDIKHFYLKRNEDESGVSGTGIVAVGAEFPSGHCVLEWLTFTSSIAIYKNIKDLEVIHSHGGKTEIVYGNIPRNSLKIEWRDIKGYEGIYKVSNIGQVKSLIKKEKYLKPDINKFGYHLYTLKGKKYYAHRLVLETFKGAAPEDKNICRHLDGNPSNNNIDNLCWRNAYENAQDKILHGTSNDGDKNGMAKLSNSQVIKVREEFSKRTTTVVKFIEEKSKELGISKDGLKKILYGTSYKGVK